MADLEIYRKNPIHTRSIITTIFNVDEETIMVEAGLLDKRMVTTYSMTRGAREPGVLHDITIRLLVGVRDMVIQDVEAGFGEAPLEECQETRDILKALIGKKIETGFTSMVKKTFGGPKGCAHQNTLLLSMVSAAVQGAWTHRWSKPLEEKDSSRKMAVLSTVNTCWVWREDGPLAQRIKAKIAEETD